MEDLLCHQSGWLMPEASLLQGKTTRPGLACGTEHSTSRPRHCSPAHSRHASCASLPDPGLPVQQPEKRACGAHSDHIEVGVGDAGQAAGAHADGGLHGEVLEAHLHSALGHSSPALVVHRLMWLPGVRIGDQCWPHCWLACLLACMVQGQLQQQSVLHLARMVQEGGSLLPSIVKLFEQGKGLLVLSLQHTVDQQLVLHHKLGTLRQVWKTWKELLQEVQHHPSGALTNIMYRNVQGL